MKLKLSPKSETDLIHAYRYIVEWQKEWFLEQYDILDPDRDYTDDELDELNVGASSLEDDQAFAVVTELAKTLLVDVLKSVDSVWPDLQVPPHPPEHVELWDDHVRKITRELFRRDYTLWDDVDQLHTQLLERRLSEVVQGMALARIICGNARTPTDKGVSKQLAASYAAEVAAFEEEARCLLQS